MRVAVAFILLFSIAFAFTIEKERPVFEGEADEQQFFDIGGKNEPEVQTFGFNGDENEPEVQKFESIGDENEPEVPKFVGIGDESQEDDKVIGFPFTFKIGMSLL